MSTPLKQAILPDLEKAPCIALTTFRKTGQPVMTPVWFAISSDTIYVETHAGAGKLKRLARTARVTFAACTFSGKVTGSVVMTGRARILIEPEKSKAASAALSGKYGVMRSIHHSLRNARCVLQRKPQVESVYIAIDSIAIDSAIADSSYRL